MTILSALFVALQCNVVISLPTDNIIFAPKVSISGIGTVQVSKNIAQFDNSIIVGAYYEIIERFFLFENVDKCTPSGIDIMIITSGEMNDKKYFEQYSEPGYIYYGRYFRGIKTLYITPKAIHNTHNFAHELAHYFYDSCSLGPYDDKYEHNRIKLFLESI